MFMPGGEPEWYWRMLQEINPKPLIELVSTGGPFLHHGGEDQQRCFVDSTCRKFRRFLTEKAG
jgi:hypothetical protein